MSAKLLKVYGWSSFRPECRSRSHQTREIVAAASRASAARTAGITSRGELAEMCETQDGEELGLALADPGVVFWHPLDDSRTWYMVVDGKSQKIAVCNTCFREHAPGQPHRPPAADILLRRLSESASVTDRNVLFMLRMSVHPDDGRVYPDRGKNAVGDEYAEFGRVRSQAIQRTIRRAHELGLTSERRSFVPTPLCTAVIAAATRDGG